MSFQYFLTEANPANGLIADRNGPWSPASIAAVGLALSSYPVGVERGSMTRAAAAGRTLATLRFFWNAPHGPEHDATGYNGFHYHFLDMKTGRHVWNCELSTADTALLLAGVLVAGADGIVLLQIGCLAAILEIVAAAIAHESIADAAKIDPDMRELVDEERTSIN